MLEEHHADASIGKHVDSRQIEAANMGTALNNATSAQSRAKDIAYAAGPLPSLPSIAHESSRSRHEELLLQLQSQLQVHSGIIEDQRQQLEDQRQDIERIDRGIGTLFQEQGNIIVVLKEVRAELHAAAGARAGAKDASDLDILTGRLQSVAAKANEVEGLRVQIDIMRRQLRRIERPGSPALPSPEPQLPAQSHDISVHGHSQAQSQSQPPPQARPPSAVSTPAGSEHRSLMYQSPADGRLPPPNMIDPRGPPLPEPDSRTLPSFRSIDPATSGMGSWRPAGEFTPVQPPAPISTHTPHEAPVSGWAAVNSNAKRNVPVDGHPPSFESPVSGSPKRQRLAPLMPRATYNDQSLQGGTSPYHGTPADSVPGLPLVPSLAGSQGPSMESNGSLPPPNPLRIVAFSSQQGQDSVDDHWRHDRQGSGRGSPRRGRGGSGRSRGRKSGGESESTPEYERADWSQVAQATTGMYYPPGDSRGGVVRRGGSQAVGDRPADTTMSSPGFVADPRFMPITTTADVASSGAQPSKKTRTKPYRNADGILIRKDGRPDMRSVSSAMNLKKVHAKKEAERSEKARSSEQDDTKGHTEETPDSDQEDEGTPEPGPEHDYETHDGVPNVEEPSTQERHNESMRKIFPYGIDGGAVQSIPQPLKSELPGTDETVKTTTERVDQHVEGGVTESIVKSVTTETAAKNNDIDHDGAKPLIDGERSMVDHVQGDIEMHEA